MKFYGAIGFWFDSFEVKPGVYKPAMVEAPYTGDVGWDNRHYQSTENQNGDIRLNNQISILGDLYAHENLSSIRYIRWKGAKWAVTNVEVSYPRLTLTIGGVYNGPGAETTPITQ